MKKHSFFIVMFLVGMFIAGTLFVVTRMKNNQLDKQFEDAKYICYTVKQGDTLWDIAKENNNFEVSTQEYISKIFKINNMSTETIYVGDAIILPILTDN